MRLTPSALSQSAWIPVPWHSPWNEKLEWEWLDDCDSLPAKVDAVQSSPMTPMLCGEHGNLSGVFEEQKQ